MNASEEPNPSIILTCPFLLVHCSRFPPKTRWMSSARHVFVVSRNNFFPVLPHPSVAFARRAVVAINRRGRGNRFGHIFASSIKRNRKEKEDGATVRVSALPTSAARQSGEPAQSSRAPFARPLLNNIMLFDYVISLQHVSPKEPSTPLRGRIAAHAIHALTWGGLGNPMLPFLEKVDVNNKHTLCCSSTRLAAARQTCWRK